MRPPVTLPHAAIPTTSASLFLKYPATMVDMGVSRHPLPKPVQTPWARMICQYVLLMDVMKVPNMTRSTPTVVTIR